MNEDRSVPSAAEYKPMILVSKKYKVYADISWGSSLLRRTEEVLNDVLGCPCPDRNFHRFRWLFDS